MKPDVLLHLISSLYEQLLAANTRIEQLEAALAAQQEAKPE